MCTSTEDVGETTISKVICQVAQMCIFQLYAWNTWVLIVSADGIQPSQEKVKAVVEWPKPQSVRDVTSRIPWAG